MNNELVRIGNVDILSKEYNGQRVVTFKDIDAVHGRPDGTARKRFNDNKEHFVEKEDYFNLTTKDSLMSEKRTLEIPNRGLTVFTENGYLMLVKSLSDDLAWEVQREIVNSYFRGKETIIDRSKLSPQMQMFYALADSQAEIELEQKRLSEKQDILEKKMEQQEETLQIVKDTFSKDTGKDFHTWVNNCITAIAESSNYKFVGSRESKYRAVRGESYIRLKNKKGCNLDDRVAKAKGRALNAKPSITKKELESINKLSIIADDKALKPIYETVIKEMMICYCVDLKGGDSHAN